MILRKRFVYFGCFVMNPIVFMKIVLRVLGLALCSQILAVSAAAAADDRSAFTKAVATSRIYGFMEILRNSGLPEETVNGPGVTLIISVDTAFYTLPPEKYAALLAPGNRELAAKYIKAHVAEGKWTLEDLAKGGVRTLGGVELKGVVRSGGEPGRINGLKVVTADQTGGKGIFHLVDGFLFTP